MSLDTHFLLTVRGTLIPATLEAARVLHNDTAGSQAGINAARALGDLSHKVYAPRPGAPGAQPGELLFIDVWVDPQGIGQFFSNPQVQQQGGRMFSARDATIWMRAPGSFSCVLQAPANKTARIVGLVRGRVSSVESAIAAFVEADRGAQRDARRRGLIAHELFVKVPMPGDTSPAELLGVDLWCDGAGMTEHYADPTHLAPLRNAFAGPPQASLWDQAEGNWSEW